MDDKLRPARSTTIREYTPIPELNEKERDIVERVFKALDSYSNIDQARILITCLDIIRIRVNNELVEIQGRQAVLNEDLAVMSTLIKEHENGW